MEHLLIAKSVRKAKVAIYKARHRARMVQCASGAVRCGARPYRGHRRPWREDGKSKGCRRPWREAVAQG